MAKFTTFTADDVRNMTAAKFKWLTSKQMTFGGRGEGARFRVGNHIYVLTTDAAKVMMIRHDPEAAQFLAGFRGKAARKAPKPLPKRPAAASGCTATMMTLRKRLKAAGVSGYSGKKKAQLCAMATRAGVSTQK